jgi:uncharacterized membrane protein YcjF (UPF0283 family)
MTESAAPTEAGASAIAPVADSARRRASRLATADLIIGLVLVAGSLLVWPRALFALLASVSIGSALLMVVGVLLLFWGLLLIRYSARRIVHLRHNVTSVAEARDVFISEPTGPMAAGDIGHGLSMDASTAEPTKPAEGFPGNDS